MTSQDFDCYGRPTSRNGCDKCGAPTKAFYCDRCNEEMIDEWKYFGGSGGGGGSYEE